MVIAIEICFFKKSTHAMSKYWSSIGIVLVSPAHAYCLIYITSALACVYIRQTTCAHVTYNYATYLQSVAILFVITTVMEYIRTCIYGMCMSVQNVITYVYVHSYVYYCILLLA